MDRFLKCAACRYCRVRSTVQFTALVMLSALTVAMGFAEGLF